MVPKYSKQLQEKHGKRLEGVACYMLQIEVVVVVVVYCWRPHQEIEFEISISSITGDEYGNDLKGRPLDPEREFVAK